MNIPLILLELASKTKRQRRVLNVRYRSYFKSGRQFRILEYAIGSETYGGWTQYGMT